MRKKPLGSTGFDITPVGFGAWALGGAGWRYGWGAQDDADSAATIRYALETGVNWIDTAAVYGLGHSEEVVARALAGIPEADRPYIFTKCGLVWDPLAPGAPPHRVMAEASVRREVEDSLRRLRVEAIDLLQVHWPDTGASLEWSEADGGSDGVHATPLEEYWQVMADLKAEGKVRAIGLSNHGLDQLQLAEKVAHVDVVQPPFSTVNRSAAPVLGWAAEHGTGVIAYSPMQSGLLTGAFSRRRVELLPENDWRKRHPDFTTGLDSILRLVDALQPIAARHRVTIASLAVAWVLAWPGLTGAIVGARSPEQVDGWSDAASLTLDSADLGEIAAAITASGAGEGPVLPS